MGAGKQIVFPTYGYRTDAVFYRVVIYTEHTIRGIYAQFIPAGEAIYQSLYYCAIG